MIDIHAHVLYGVDDGPSTLEESVNIVKNAYQAGVTDLIVTPHYIMGSIYSSRVSNNRKILNEIKEACGKNMNINLYLGNEIFVENNLVDLIAKCEATTLNCSNYILFELPRNSNYNGLRNLIFELKAMGAIPIIAHPERYEFLKEDPTKIQEIIEWGALFQCNIGSFFDVYGKEAKRCAMLFLKHHMISFISSDVHSSSFNTYNYIEEFKKLAKKNIGDSEIEDILVNNAKKVLNNENIDYKEYTPIIKDYFGYYK